MKLDYKFYIFATLAFISLPILISLLLSFQVFGQPFQDWYYAYRPYGYAIFQSKGSLWNFIGVTTAFIGIAIGFLYQDKKKSEVLKASVRSLREEILVNMELLFTGDVERPYYYKALENIINNHMDAIKNDVEFRKIRALYDEMRYYQEVVRVWRPSNGVIVTEKHANTCNKYVEYFQGQGVSTGITNKDVIDFQLLRDLAIASKIENIKNWETTLQGRINSIFQ